MQTQSQQEKIEELANREQVAQESVILKNMIDKNKSVGAEFTNVAQTLLARDYKGANNFGFNGVIEWKLD